MHNSVMKTTAVRKVWVFSFITLIALIAFAAYSKAQADISSSLPESAAAKQQSSKIAIETGAYGPVTFDQSNAFAQTASFSKTNSTKSKLLMVAVTGGGVAPISVTYNSKSMTKVTEHTAYGNNSIWKLDNPPAGTHDVVINFSYQTRSFGTAASFIGTNSRN